jgi:hypothetical protein
MTLLFSLTLRCGQSRWSPVKLRGHPGSEAQWDRTTGPEMKARICGIWLKNIHHIITTLSPHYHHIISTLSAHIHHIITTLSAHYQHIFTPLLSHYHYLYDQLSLLMSMWIIPDSLNVRTYRTTMVIFEYVHWTILAVVGLPFKRCPW